MKPLINETPEDLKWIKNCAQRTVRFCLDGNMPNAYREAFLLNRFSDMHVHNLSILDNANERIEEAHREFLGIIGLLEEIDDAEIKRNCESMRYRARQIKEIM